MPIDWKSADSKDRLLAAVIASMGPTPKLDYKGMRHSFVSFSPSSPSSVSRNPPCCFVLSILSLWFPLADIGRFFGGGAKYYAVWYRMGQVIGNAADLQAAVDRGEDPITVELKDRPVHGGKGKGILIHKSVNFFLLLVDITNTLPSCWTLILMFPF